MYLISNLPNGKTIMLDVSAKGEQLIEFLKENNVFAPNISIEAIDPQRFY